MPTWSSRIVRPLAVIAAALLPALAIAPASAAEPEPFTVLAFHNPQNGDGAHVAFDRHAIDWFTEQAPTHGFTFQATTDWNRLSSLSTKDADVVVFLDDAPQSAAQHAGFRSYMEKGGGWLGFHVAAFNMNPPAYASWYHDTFLGTGDFTVNSWGPTAETLRIDDRHHPVTAGLGERIASPASEWYAWEKDLRANSHIDVLASLDPSTFPVGDNTNPDKPWERWAGGDFPIVWSNSDYRMVYANFGHELMTPDYRTPKSSTFDSAQQNTLILNALAYVAGRSDAVTTPPATGVTPGRDHVLRNAATGQCVDARAAKSANGTVIQQYTCNGTIAQKFRFTPTTDDFGTWALSAAPTQVIDVTGRSLADGAATQLWGYGGGHNQQWRVRAEASGSVSIASRASGMCLTSVGSAAGTVLVQAACDGSARQRFTVS